MAQYTINFSSNASDVIKELDRVVSSVAKVEKAGSKVVLDLDTSRLSAGIDATFRKLNRQIENSQRVLNKLQIGGPNFQRIAETLGTRQGLRERGRAIAEPIQLRAQSKAFEEGSLVRFSKELQALQIEASQIKPNSQEWASFQQQIGRIQGELKKADQAAEAIQLRENLGAFAPGSLDQLSGRLKLLKIEANAISPSTDKWKAINAEIQKTEKGIERISKKPLTAGQRAGAAGGAFLYGGGLGGGAGSALGGIAGGLAGGVPGAFAGAAVGQAVDNLTQYAAAIGTVVAETNKAKIALAGVSSSQKDYAAALGVATGAGQKYLLPLSDATRQFTKLQASVRGAGFDTDTTAKVFNGVASAIIATGGSTEDLNSALTATSQVFSKGKVSAEELRQQIGERLPGAFTIFAQSLGKSPQELDKLLQEGKVSLNDFVKFVEELEKRYGGTAETLASAPENAGARLKVALNAATLSFGGFFQAIGAGFQNYFTNLIKFALDNEKALKRVVVVFTIAFQDLSGLVGGFVKFLAESFNKVFSYILGNLDTVLARIEAAINRASSAAKLTPQKIENLQTKARVATEQKFGASVFGVKTSLVLDTAGAEKFYNQYFNKLVDTETGAAKKASRTKKLESALFPQFTPSKFGAGLGAEGAKGDGLGTINKEKKKKADGLESYHSLQDQLAKNFTQDQLQRMEQEYQARVDRINSEFDLREARANSFQKEAIRFEKQMSDIELKRQKALLDASADVIRAQGSVAGGAGANLTGGGGFSTAQLQRASSEASKFTGIANMCSESVKAFYKSLGISLPGVTAWADTVRKAGKTMTDWSKLQAGDIVATGRPGDTPHVGVYTGGNNVFHQSRKRGLKAGNYPDLDYFKSGYFVRPNAMDAGAPRKVTGDEKRDVIADQKAQLAMAQQSLTVRLADAQAVREAAVAWAQYSASIVPIEEQALQNDILSKKNELVKASLPEDVIEKELKYFEAQQKTTLAIAENNELLTNGTIDQKEHAKRLLELQTRLAGYNTELDRNIQLQRQQSFDASMGALQKQITMATPIGGTGLAAGFIGDAGSKYEEAIKEGRSQDEAARFAELQNQLTLLETRNGAVKSSILAIGDAFATAMTTGVSGLIDGTATAQEVFANFLKSVADALMQAAQQMIATYIAIGIAKLFAGMGGGGGLGAGGAGFGGSNSFSSFNAGGAQAFSMPSLMAEGGFVSGPTSAIIGEGGESEYVIPSSKMESAMARYSRGARGESVIAGSGGGGEGGTATAAAGPMVVDVRYNVERINEVEYVTASQFQAGLRQAAQQGAALGERNTVRRLQYSPGGRKGVGV